MRPREKAISDTGDPAAGGFILRDAQHTSNRGGGSSPEEEKAAAACIKSSLGWESCGGLSTPVGTGILPSGTGSLAPAARPGSGRASPEGKILEGRRRRESVFRAGKQGNSLVRCEVKQKMLKFVGKMAGGGKEMLFPCQRVAGRMVKSLLCLGGRQAFAFFSSFLFL